MLHLPLFFYSCFGVAGIAIIVLNYYDSLTNRRQLDTKGSVLSVTHVQPPLGLGIYIREVRVRVRV